MQLTPQTIKTQLQAIPQGKKAVFKNDEGKVKVCFLKNGYYSVTIAAPRYFTNPNKHFTK